MPDYVTIKLHADTRRLLRLIAAQTDEQMVQVMQRLCENEWAKIQPNRTNDLADDSHTEKSTAQRRITKPKKPSL
jgi:hypothetical protein